MNDMEKWIGDKLKQLNLVSTIYDNNFQAIQEDFEGIVADLENVRKRCKNDIFVLKKKTN